jgi:hypothetical protein
MDIDTLGPTALKESDCSADASITANQFYLFAYNGTVFCKVGSRGGATWGAITGTLQEQPDLAAALAAKQNALGFTPENTAGKGQPDGYASLGADGKVPSEQLPPGGAAWGAITGALQEQPDLAAALAAKQNTLGFTPENTAGKGQPDGYASLGADGKVPTEQLPPGGAAWGAITGALQEQPDLAAALAAKQNTLGFTPENTAGKGQPDGYASLGADGKVSSEQLPSGEARTYFRSPQTVRATAIAPTANDARLWAFYVDAPVRYSMILLPVIGVDTNPCADGANCYDIGIFDDAGNLVSNTGPMSITGSGGLRQFTFAQGERRMEIGWYHFAVTGSANAATFGGHATSQSVVYSKRVNASGGATSGGALPATVTMPAESWAFSSIPAFTLR